MYCVLLHLCHLGPPSLPIITASSPKGNEQNVTLHCTVSSLDNQQKNMYYWKWTFNGNEVKESDIYRTSFAIELPNSCEQSTGSTSLHIVNVSSANFGPYKCAIIISNRTFGEDAILLSKGKIVENYKSITALTVRICIDVMVVLNKCNCKL